MPNRVLRVGKFTVIGGSNRRSATSQNPLSMRQRSLIGVGQPNDLSQLHFCPITISLLGALGRVSIMISTAASAVALLFSRPSTVVRNTVPQVVKNEPRSLFCD